MFSYQCDCCDKMKKADDREPDGWWVVATGYYRRVGGENVEFQIWEFPTGSKLSEPHEGLFHVCSSAHLLELMKRLLKEKYKQDREKERNELIGRTAGTD